MNQSLGTRELDREAIGTFAVEGRKRSVLGSAGHSRHLSSLDEDYEETIMSFPAKAWSLHRTTPPPPRQVIGQLENLSVSLITDQPGWVEFGGSPNVIVSLHVGPSVDGECRRLGERHRGRTIHGDIEVIPPRTPGVWELKTPDVALVIGLGLAAIHRVVEESGRDSARFEVCNRFQVRDTQIEHIGWALKAEMEQDYPCGRLYADSLATALAAALVQRHSTLARPQSAPRHQMAARTLRHVLAYIEDNLSSDVRMRDIANAGGVSVSYFKSQFRRSMGLPVHQYLIRRRVERAVMLLRAGRLSIGQVALETGFCHQSHLALHVRRVLGVTPLELRNGARAGASDNGTRSAEERPWGKIPR